MPANAGLIPKLAWASSVVKSTVAGPINPRLRVTVTRMPASLSPIDVLNKLSVFFPTKTADVNSNSPGRWSSSSIVNTDLLNPRVAPPVAVAKVRLTVRFDSTKKLSKIGMRSVWLPCPSRKVTVARIGT